MTATTAKAGHWLRTIPAADAAALVAAVESAHARLPDLMPGVRCIMSGLAWRVEAHGYRVTFGTVNGAAMIVAGSPVPQSARKGRKAA